MEHYAGIDVSLELSSVCVVDGRGKIVKEAKVASEPEVLGCFFKELGVPVNRIGLEAGPLSQWLHAGLTQAGFQTVLLETRQWSEEPSARANRRKIRARIGGLHCSLCTGTIEKALGRLPGVDKVAVSLTHEQALVEYDPAVARPEQFLQTLRDIGYTISDPRKLRPLRKKSATSCARHAVSSSPWC